MTLGDVLDREQNIDRDSHALARRIAQLCAYVSPASGGEPY